MRRIVTDLPSIQLARKAAVFGLAREELWHDVLGKELPIANHKCLPVRKPADRRRVRVIVQNLVQLHRKDLAIIVTLLIGVVRVLLCSFGTHG